MAGVHCTVLVTAVGAVIGYGVVRCLRQSSHEVRIIGTDIYPDAVGQRWCDHFSQAVPAKDPRFIDYLLEMIARFEVQLVIPGTEYEIEALHQNREQLAQAGAVVLLNRPEVIDSMHDKWKAVEFFTSAGIPTIPSRIDDDFASAVADLGLPMLSKLRCSDAGKGMRVVHDEAEFRACRTTAGDNFMVQRIVGSDDEEFTASVFGFGDGTALNGPILRRKLSKAGATDKAWTMESPELAALIDSLTAHLRPLGPTNYQFRKDGDRYVVLEVNPRISSATSIREAFGFNEAALCIEWFINENRPLQPTLRSGSALRYLADAVVYDDDGPPA
ncbi:MAG: ATP-grasp domain-containing protein [Verrucomicrobia bacterium]|nr:ATP-grasp domain-containing protein [Verrucomicrobiota bacterium]